MDRLAGSSFFPPRPVLATDGGQILDISGGGSPLLYQHLFLVPGASRGLRPPSSSYRYRCRKLSRITPGSHSGVTSRWSTLCSSSGSFPFIVWAHHMYLTGMGNAVSTFFQTTTVLISIPSVILLTCLMISLWGGSIRFTVPMLFASAFLPMFGFGGLTGLPLAFNLTDLHLHDTYYVIGHFHYVGRSRHAFWSFCRNLLLVSQSHRVGI